MENCSLAIKAGWVCHATHNIPLSLSSTFFTIHYFKTNIAKITEIVWKPRTERARGVRRSMCIRVFRREVTLVRHSRYDITTRVLTCITANSPESYFDRTFLSRVRHKRLRRNKKCRVRATFERHVTESTFRVCLIETFGSRARGLLVTLHGLPNGPPLRHRAITRD